MKNLGLSTEQLLQYCYKVNPAYDDMESEYVIAGLESVELEDNILDLDSGMWIEMPAAMVIRWKGEVTVQDEGRLFLFHFNEYGSLDDFTIMVWDQPEPFPYLKP